jgi:HSP20 family protein
MAMNQGHVPVKLYQSAERVTIAAPMPGLEPADILVRVTATGHLELHGKRRGPRQDEMTLLLDEWSVGPYERTLVLPCPVDGSLADVTYGNGVLVVALPKAVQTQTADLAMVAVGLARGQRVGSHGKSVTPTTTEAHRQAKAEAAVAGGTP